jgi:WD40 repeat protein
LSRRKTLSFVPLAVLRQATQLYIVNQVAQGNSSGSSLPASSAHATRIGGRACSAKYGSLLPKRSSEPGFLPSALKRFDGRLTRPFPWMAEKRWFVYDLGMSADGRFLAAGDYGGGHAVFLVDLLEDRVVQGDLHHSDDVVKLRWSPVAPLLACVAVRSVWVWDAPAALGGVGRSGEPGSAPAVKPVHHFKGFRTTVEGLGFSPDGALLAAGAREGRVRVWEVDSGHVRADLDWKSGKLHDLTFSPDGNTLAAAYSKGVVVWDVD